MGNLKINVTYIKVLKTVNDLNEMGLYPLSEGIYKILTGQKDAETLKYSSLITYSTLISYSSKKVCVLTLMLYRYKYLEKIYDSNTNELYFKISILGKNVLEKYLKSRPNVFVKKEIIPKTTIVKI